MAFQDIYNKLAYKAKLAITQDAEKFKEIVLEQLPRILNENKIDDLLEIRKKISDKVNGLAPMAQKDLTRYTLLYLDINSEVLKYAILNDNEALFKDFRKSLEQEANLNFLIENPHPKFLANIYNEQKNMPDINSPIKNIIEKAIDQKNYTKINKLLDLFKSAEKYLDPDGQYYATTQNEEEVLTILSKGYGKTLFPNEVKDIKTKVYSKLIANNDMEALTNIMKDNNINLDRDLVNTLIKHDRADFLKSLLINPEFTINKENNSHEVVSILNPDALFLMAAKSGAINTMKFALEFNDNIFNQETLNYTLQMSVKNRNPQVVDYLLKDLGSHYTKETLNDVAKSVLENRDYVMLKYMKDRSSLIEIEVPNVGLESREDIEKKLESKIERLRNQSYPEKSDLNLKNNIG